MRLGSRITRLAVGEHLPRRAVRVRLTLLYGALFLISGAALIAVMFTLFINATGFVLKFDSGWSVEVGNGNVINLSHRAPRTLPQCYPRCVPRPPSPAQQRRMAAQVNDRHGHVLRYLVLESGIALGAMALLSLGLGWMMAGRVLQPLEDSYQAQRQFVANASHELRAPLTRQRALIQVALADPRASLESLRSAHERALASEEHLEQLIDGLLALTRGQAGMERPQRLDLAVLAAQAVQARESQPGEAELKLETSLSPAPLTGDERLLERLIGNLVDNAVRHNVANGHVEIATGTRDRRAFLSVTNSGPQIRPEDVQRLFQPFERLGSARTRHNNGHGLGLSIVQAIANAHGAELSASPRPDGGLSVEVLFATRTGYQSPELSAA